MAEEHITISDTFIQSFLKPLSVIFDKGALKIENGNLLFSAFNGNDSIGFRYKMEIDSNVDDRTICVGNLSKFKNLLEKATDLEENDKLIISNNCLKYSSSKWRFKHFLLDESLATVRNFNENIIKDYDEKVSFLLNPEAILDVFQLKAFHTSDVDKVYIKNVDGKLFAFVTDYQKTNTDDMGVLLTEKFEWDNTVDRILIPFEMFKVLKNHKKVPFKLKSDGNSVLARTIDDGVDIVYIVSQLVK